FSTHVRVVTPRFEAPPIPPAPAGAAEAPAAAPAVPSTEFWLDEFENVTFRAVDANLNPYETPAEYTSQRVRDGTRVVRNPAPAAPAAPGAVGGGNRAGGAREPD